MLLLYPPLSTGTHLEPHHEPMGSGSDGDDYESLAILLAIAMTHLPNTRHTLLVLAEDEDGRRLRHVVVDARDRRERGGR